MAFQERNETCGMKLECSGWNLAEKSRTDRDLKWDEICSVFWIGMECFGHSGWNETELTTLVRNWLRESFLIIFIVFSCKKSFQLKFYNPKLTHFSYYNFPCFFLLEFEIYWFYMYYAFIIKEIICI
jgi:hypothetical protein